MTAKPAMNPIMPIFLLFVCFLICPTYADELKQAREAFRRDVAVAYAINVNNITVQPVHAGLPDNPFDALKTGPFFALRADFPGNDPGPCGFASSGGITVFAKGFKGAGALMEACGVWQETLLLPVGEIVKRLEWMFHAGSPVRMLEAHPGHQEVSEPTFHRGEKNEFEIRYFVERFGPTGLVTCSRIIYRGDHNKTITREETRLP